MTLSKNARRIAAGTIAAAALGMAAASNAHAVSTWGCTVTPWTPEYSYTQSNGVKVLDYKVSVNCYSGRTAVITQERWEEDDWPNGDDLVGTSTLSGRGVTVLHNYRTLVDGEIGMEEMYQRVRFYVRMDNASTSGTTGWHYSATRGFYN